MSCNFCQTQSFKKFPLRKPRPKLVVFIYIYIYIYIDIDIDIDIDTYIYKKNQTFWKKNIYI